MYSTSMYNQRNIDYNKDELQNIPRFMYTTTTESNNLDQNIPYNRDQKPLQNLITLLCWKRSFPFRTNFIAC